MSDLRLVGIGVLEESPDDVKVLGEVQTVGDHLIVDGHIGGVLQEGGADCAVLRVADQGDHILK